MKTLQIFYQKNSVFNRPSLNALFYFHLYYCGFDEKKLGYVSCRISKFFFLFLFSGKRSERRRGAEYKKEIVIDVIINLLAMFFCS